MPKARRFPSHADSGNRKYTVDVAGDLPVSLMEMDTETGSIDKTYVYANGQVLARHDGDMSADKQFYLHDRLGSVRQVIGEDGDVAGRYLFNPFGEKVADELEEPAAANPFAFAGQYYDSELGQYYMRARQYDPALCRFTGRDPMFGKFKEPLTLHVYLYCLNDPVNHIDPTGELADTAMAVSTGSQIWGMAASAALHTGGRIVGQLVAAVVKYQVAKVAVVVATTYAYHKYSDDLFNTGISLMTGPKYGEGPGEPFRWDDPYNTTGKFAHDMGEGKMPPNPKDWKKWLGYALCKMLEWLDVLKS